MRKEDDKVSATNSALALYIDKIIGGVPTTNPAWIDDDIRIAFQTQKFELPDHRYINYGRFQKSVNKSDKSKLWAYNFAIYFRSLAPETFYVYGDFDTSELIWQRHSSHYLFYKNGRSFFVENAAPLALSEMERLRIRRLDPEFNNRVISLPNGAWEDGTPSPLRLEDTRWYEFIFSTLSDLNTHYPNQIPVPPRS